ncbi:MAG: hypothetical protein EOO92_12305 [Pedobacter sp.]|nr:MAG: hypothetical protein EOO92_12305 [Pedobacter sp.]
MGKYKNGILGAFSGKIGAVIGASWRGIDYMRSLPETSNKPATTKQLGQRMKMKLFRGFLLKIDDLIETCFQNYTQTSATNGALSYNMTHAVGGEYPDMCIDFQNLVFSKGDLQGSWSPSVSSTEENIIDFNWTNGPFSALRGENDQVILILYSQLHSSFITLTHAGLRSAGTAKIQTEKVFKGDTVHCYLSFYSNEMNMSSSNEYIGQITIA